MHKIFQIIFRYKILHIIFWGWFAVETITQRKRDLGVSFIEDIHNVLAIVLIECGCVYFISYFLVPRFLDGKEYTKFILYSLLTILCASGLLGGLLSIYLLFGARLSHSIFSILLMYTTELAINSVILVSVITYAGRFKAEQKNRLLERQKLKAELDFLRAQINPHFLFNVLNSIKVLIRTDPQKAENTLAKFASILRYGLYETKLNLVRIVDEINNLSDYIEVERIRIDKSVPVTFNVRVGNDDILIAPLLFLPFIENAFKYVSKSQDQSNFIDISLTATDTYLDFKVVNSCETKQFKSKKLGGIGLQNVKRRLDLLYNGCHELTIEGNEVKYVVDLKIFFEKH